MAREWARSSCVFSESLERAMVGIRKDEHEHTDMIYKEEHGCIQ